MLMLWMTREGTKLGPPFSVSRFSTDCRSLLSTLRHFSFMDSHSSRCTKFLPSVQIMFEVSSQRATEKSCPSVSRDVVSSARAATLSEKPEAPASLLHSRTSSWAQSHANQSGE